MVFLTVLVVFLFFGLVFGFEIRALCVIVSLSAFSYLKGGGGLQILPILGQLNDAV